MLGFKIHWKNGTRRVEVEVSRAVVIAILMAIVGTGSAPEVVSALIKLDSRAVPSARAVPD
jgi:hypothetical protein